MSEEEGDCWINELDAAEESEIAAGGRAGSKDGVIAVAIVRGVVVKSWPGLAGETGSHAELTNGEAFSGAEGEFDMRRTLGSPLSGVDGRIQGLGQSTRCVGACVPVDWWVWDKGAEKIKISADSL